MSTNKVFALLAVPLAAILLVAGCSSPAPAKDSHDDGGSASSAAPDKTAEPDAPAAGELAAPGTRVGVDTWLTHSFTNTDKGTALLSARLVSIELVSDAQRAFLDSTFNKGQLDGYDVWMILVDEKKESGDSVKFDSDYSYFDAVNASDAKIQQVTLIGWDECKTNSFDEAFDTAGGIVQQCFLAAVPSGAKAPAGVAYIGGYEDDNPYDFNDGNSLFFIKG